MGPARPGTRIPLPFALLQRLPGLANPHSPYRFQMPAALGALVAIAMPPQFGLKKMGPRPRMAVLAILTTTILFDPFVGRFGWPFRVMGMPEVPFYETIRRDPSDSVLLEIPVGVRHGTDRIGTDGEILTFYQPVHEKRMVNGLATRAPYAAMEYYRRSPALMFFAGEKPPPGEIDADLAQKLVSLTWIRPGPSKHAKAGPVQGSHGGPEPLRHSQACHGSGGFGRLSAHQRGGPAIELIHRQRPCVALLGGFNKKI